MTLRERGIGLTELSVQRPSLDEVFLAITGALSWIFALFGVVARSASSVQGISMLVLMPLTFLSNAFVPVDSLPGPLKWFAGINPVSYLDSAVRDLANEGIVGTNLLWSLVGAAIVVAISAPLTVRAYMRKA